MLEQFTEKSFRMSTTICQSLILQYLFIVIVSASSRIKPQLSESMTVQKVTRTNADSLNRNKSSEIIADGYLPKNFVKDTLEIENISTLNDRNRRVAIGDHSIADALAVQHHLDEIELVNEPIVEGKFFEGENLNSLCKN